MRETLKKPIVITAAAICFCFLLSSTGWLAWEYHLMDLTTARVSDLMTMVIGYLLQACGIGVFAALLRRRGSFAVKLIPAAMILHTLCLIPAVLSRSLAGTLAAGFLVNLFCGYIAGYYLYILTRRVEAKRRAITLGVGYGLSILLSWLLSTLDGIYYSNRVWLVCLALTAVTLFLFQLAEGLPAKAAEEPPANKVRDDARPLLWSVGAVVLLFSVVINLGFAFSSADLAQGVRPELSRLFYALGLILAGVITDGERKHGAAAALSALVIPFIMLALRSEPISLTVFWALSYFTFGFLSIFRMIVFSDLAEKNALLFLSGFGLLIGRIGDAAGESLCLALLSNLTAMVFLSALLFLAGVFLFFRIYRPLYIPETKREQSEKERFFAFAVQHDLSARERDILRLLLEERTNAEIADALSISENTVKFHVRNLLQKTGCKNRGELLALYLGHRDPSGA